MVLACSVLRKGVPTCSTKDKASQTCLLKELSVSDKPLYSRSSCSRAVSTIDFFVKTTALCYYRHNGIVNAIYFPSKPPTHHPNLQFIRISPIHLYSKPFQTPNPKQTKPQYVPIRSLLLHTMLKTRI